MPKPTKVTVSPFAADGADSRPVLEVIEPVPSPLVTTAPTKPWNSVAPPGIPLTTGLEGVARATVKVWGLPSAPARFARSHVGGERAGPNSHEGAR